MAADSTKRFEEDVGGSLREINRQMTVLRNKNTTQSLEIQRLNTKLKIAAEVKGVSVADLTAAMERVAMRDMSAEIRAKLAEAEMRAKKAELSKEASLALSRERQRAGQLELQIAEMTDRAQDFEKMKAELLQRSQQANEAAHRLQFENDQLRAEVQRSKLENMDTNETMDQVIEALQEQVQALQKATHTANQRADAASLRLTSTQDRVDAITLQRTKLTMLSTNQTELINDLQGQLDSMYAAYSMQETEIRSIQDDYRIAQARLESSDMALIQINEKIRAEAKKQRDEGDIAGAQALERLDIGAISSPGDSVNVERPVSRQSTSAPVRAVAHANAVFDASGQPMRTHQRVQGRLISSTPEVPPQRYNQYGAVSSRAVSNQRQHNVF